MQSMACSLLQYPGLLDMEKRMRIGFGGSLVDIFPPALEDGQVNKTALSLRCRFGIPPGARC